ncbi:Uncharacterised protein [Prevotella denticola]|uniref:Uncharacterized protein n=1 Tax=Prevotella denticola TaxID=28129 RepID=A0A379E4W4_9BACT|nr:Uncharacterised protein [Prevotella denticola]
MVRKQNNHKQKRLSTSNIVSNTQFYNLTDKPIENIYNSSRILTE